MSGGVTVWLVSQLRHILAVAKNLFVQCISFTIYNAFHDARSYGNFAGSDQVIFNAMISSYKTLWERSINFDCAINQFFDFSYDDACDKYFGDVKSKMPYGFSIKLMYGKIVFCSRYIDTSAQQIVINTNLRVFFANKKKFMTQLHNDLKKARNEIDNILRDNENIVVRISSTSIPKQKRSLNSIFTNNDEHVKLYNSIKSFIDNKAIYMKLNYPYKYSAILYGVPGSGKSSTILALASELKYNVEYVNMSTTSISELIKIMSSSTPNIYVFEDIDALNTCFANTRTNDNSSKTKVTTISKDDSDVKINTISLSDLLNITDGLLSCDGAICLFTTNHIEKLDPAFLRAGRMNMLVEFSYLSANAANKMIKTYLNVEVENLKDNIKPAELQDMILNILIGKKTIDDLKTAFQMSN